MKILKRLTIPIIAGILGISAFLMPAINIEYNSDTGLHVGTAITASAGSSKVQAVAMKDTLSYAVLEKSGCQIGKDGYLLLRYDLYLLPTAAGYDNWFFTIAEQQAADGGTIKGKTYKDINTPYLCVFITVPSDITADELKLLGNDIVNKSYAGLISTGSVMTSVSEIRPVLKQAKVVAITTEKETSVLTKYNKLKAITDDITIAELNPSEADTKSLSIVVGSKELPVYAGDPIDVGSAATTRSGGLINGSTYFSVDNPANDSGILDTVEVYARTGYSITGLIVGTISGSGTTYNDRDYVNIGSVTDGAKRTFTGLSIDVVTGDYIGFYATDGRVFQDINGYSGVYRCSGTNVFGTGNQTYDFLDGDTLSLYATGETAGAIAPTITNSTGESNVTATAARLNYNLTDDGGDTTTVTVYWGNDDAGTTAGNWDNNHSLGTQAEGTGYYDVSSLSEGTTYYYRYYASNSAGSDWADSTESFLTKPAAPTNVSATDGLHTDKVVITWTKSTGATGYKVYEGSNLLDTLGDVATYDDSAAAAPTITAGSAVASDGTSPDHVLLSLSGTSVANGASRTYKVVAVNATGDSADSSTDTGYRGHGTLTYQWQRSAADSDADYSNIDGATAATYNDTAGVVDPDGRYYKCLLTATGASNQTSTANRGYIAAFAEPTVSTIDCIGFGGTWAILKGYIDDEGDAGVTEVGIEYGLTDAYGTTESLTGTWTTGDYFVVFVDNLTKGTVYYYRAYADNTETGYGGNEYFNTTGSPVIYEYMNTNGDDDSAHIYANNWGSQYFLVGSESHTVSKVILKLKRTGNPGTVTVSLRHATAEGLPTGIDLVSTTLDGDAFSTSYTWYEVEFDSEYTVEGNSGYCIVVAAKAGDTDNDVQWQKDTGGDGDTTNDFASDSTDGGLTWTADAGDADYLFEVWGNPCIDVISAKVYTNYIDEGDMLFLILYENIYEPYYPYDDPSLYFEFQLLDTDGLTIIANTPCMQYEYMPAAIYLNADSASNLDWGAGYYVNLYGKFGDNPVAQYQIQAEDWLGSGLLYLKQWCLNTAYDMEEWYYSYLDTALTLVTQNSSNVYVLNQAGGTAFATGIPYLTTVFSPTNPVIEANKTLVLFENLDLVFEYISTGVIDSYSLAETWTDMVGTDVEGLASSMSDIFGGIGSKTVVAVLILFAYLIVAGIVVGKNTDNVTLALALAFPFLGFAAYIRVIDMAYIAITAAVALILMVWSYYFTRM